MSKASDWAANQKEFDKLTSAWQEYMHQSNPRLMFSVRTESSEGSACVQTNGGLSVTAHLLTPEDAVRLARWILDTFQEGS